MFFDYHKSNIVIVCFVIEHDRSSQHRRWVYDRWYNERGGLKETFVIGVEQFIQIALQ